MNMMKSLIPNIFYIIGYVLAGISLGFATTSVFFYNIGSHLHMKLNTKFGKMLSEYINAAKKVSKTKIDSITTKNQSGNNRLFTIINGDNDESSKG